jgi:GntR family transcriptional regulator
MDAAEAGAEGGIAPGALPLYLQISELLIRDIAAGRLADGARLPPEREMAVQLGIAVGTLRRALADLADKGLIERVQGSGNYIRHRPDAPSVYALFRLELAEGGGLPTAQALEVARVPKPADLPPFGDGPEAWRIRRLRRLSGVPAAVEEIFLDAALAPDLQLGSLSESLYLHYRTHLGLWIQRAEDRIDQGPLPDWAPAAFGHPPGTVLPRITRISWAQDNRRAEVSRSWFDPGRVRYVARLT